MKIQDIMKSKVAFCSPDDTAESCAELMADRNIGFVPVVENGKLAGVVTDRDIVVRLIAEKRPASTKLSEVMTRDLLTCLPTDDVEIVESRMASARKSRIAVVDEKLRCVGVVSLSDLVHADREGSGKVLDEVTRRETEAGPLSSGA